MKTLRFGTLVCAVLAASIIITTLMVRAQSRDGSQQGSTSTGGVSDPGVRSDAVTVGTPLPSLSAAQLQFFQDGLARFIQVDSVSGSISGEPGNGLKTRA